MQKFKLDQTRAPIYEALERFRKMRVVPFDVPGHKRGRGNPELVEKVLFYTGEYRLQSI